MRPGRYDDNVLFEMEPVPGGPVRRRRAEPVDGWRPTRAQQRCHACLLRLGNHPGPDTVRRARLVMRVGGRATYLCLGCAESAGYPAATDDSRRLAGREAPAANPGCASAGPEDRTPVTVPTGLLDRGPNRRGRS